MCDGFRRPRSCGGGDVVLTWVMLWSGPADTTLVSLPDTFTVVEGESERLNSSSGRRRCRGIPTNGRRQQLSSGVDVAITQTVITRLRSTRLLLGDSCFTPFQLQLVFPCTTTHIDKILVWSVTLLSAQLLWILDQADTKKNKTKTGTRNYLGPRLVIFQCQETCKLSQEKVCSFERSLCGFIQWHA